MSADLSSVRGHVDLLRHCKREKARLKEIEDAAKSAVLEAMRGAEEGMLDGEPVVRNKQVVSKRLDQTLLRATVSDAVVEECTVPSVAERFQVIA